MSAANRESFICPSQFSAPETWPRAWPLCSPRRVTRSSSARATFPRLRPLAAAAGHGARGDSHRRRRQVGRGDRPRRALRRRGRDARRRRRRRRQDDRRHHQPPHPRLHGPDHRPHDQRRRRDPEARAEGQGGEGVQHHLRPGARRTAARRPADTTTVFVAGDDASANGAVEAIARKAGFDVVQTGGLKLARYLEPLAGLNIALGYGRGLGTDIAPTWNVGAPPRRREPPRQGCNRARASGRMRASSRLGAARFVWLERQSGRLPPRRRRLRRRSRAARRAAVGVPALRPPSPRPTRRRGSTAAGRGDNGSASPGSAPTIANSGSSRRARRSIASCRRRSPSAASPAGSTASLCSASRRARSWRSTRSPAAAGRSRRWSPLPAGCRARPIRFPLAAATPVLLLHGEADATVPAEESRRAATRLKAAGFAVEARFFARLGHSISGEGVEAAGTFLARALTPA